MKKILLNQKGFTALETILIAVVLAGVVGAGVYVWTSRQEANNESSAVEVSKTTKLDQAKVESTVDAFYKEYIEAEEPNSTELSSNAAENLNAVAEKYGSKKFLEFYNEPKQYDPVLCTQDVIDTYKLKSSRLDSSSASVKVNLSYNNSEGYEVTVKLDPSYKIDSVDCPAN